MSTDYKGTTTGAQALDVYIRLSRAFEAMSARINRHLADYQLTASQFGILEAIYDQGPLCQKDLAQRILKSSGNITFVIDNLIKRDLVERHRSADDRRFVEIILTEEGRRLIAGILPRHLDIVAGEVGVLTPEEQAQLAHLCRKIGSGNP